MEHSESGAGEAKPTQPKGTGGGTNEGSVFLPSKPSELILVALGALEVTEANPHYQIGMGVWHQPLLGQCTVCLAGAVMATSLRADPAAALYPANFAEEAKLHALNFFRLGRLDMALDELGVKRPAHLPTTHWVRGYLGSPAGFKADLRELAYLLAKVGL